MYMKFKKPNWEDRIVGASEFIKEMLVNLLFMNFAHAKLNWILAKLTIMGKFEVKE